MLLVNVLSVLFSVNGDYANSRHLTCNDIKVPTIFIGSSPSHWWQLTIDGSMSSVKQVSGLAPIDIRLGGSDSAYLHRTLGQTDNLLFARGLNLQLKREFLVIYDLKTGTQLMERDLAYICATGKTVAGFAVGINTLLLVCREIFKRLGTLRTNSIAILYLEEKLNSSFGTDVHEFAVKLVEPGVYRIEEEITGVTIEELVWNDFLAIIAGEVCITINVKTANCFNSKTNKWNYRKSVPTLITSTSGGREFMTTYYNETLYDNSKNSLCKTWDMVDGWSIFAGPAMNLYRNKVYVPIARINGSGTTELNILNLVEKKSEFIFQFPLTGLTASNHVYLSYIFIKPCSDMQVTTSGPILSDSTEKMIGICLLVILIFLVVLASGILGTRYKTNIKKQTKTENKPFELDPAKTFDYTQCNGDTSSKQATSHSVVSIHGGSRSKLNPGIGESKCLTCLSATDDLSVFNTENTNQSKDYRKGMPSGHGVTGSSAVISHPPAYKLSSKTKGDQSKTAALINHPQPTYDKNQKVLDSKNKSVILSNPQPKANPGRAGSENVKHR